MTSNSNNQHSSQSNVNSENPTEIQTMNLALDLDLLGNSDDFYVSDEDGYEWDSDEEQMMSSERLSINNNAKDDQPDLTVSKGALVPFVPDGIDGVEEDIDSDEEKDLLKDIKDEIQQKCREEMKSELEMYKEKIKAIENGHISDKKDSNKNDDDDLKDLDPKIKEGLIKMRKLDRILNKKVRREKEVKKDRILLERRMREEIDELNNEGNRENREVKSNTDKYLLLSLPPSHNEGVVVDEPEVTPVFQTQLDDDTDTTGKHRNDIDEKRTNSKSSNLGNKESNDKIFQEGKSNKKKKKDFIKRNKELAAQAEGSIAMTEEEKVRVAGLLTDLDALTEEPDHPQSVMSLDNPYQIAVHAGEGYLPDNIELRSLANIDSQLKNILPSDEYESLMSTPTAYTPQHKLFTRVDVKSSIDFDKYGEKALLETKEQRDMNEKLKRIEEELALFSNPREMKLESPSLSGDQLNELLDQCARSISRSSYITDNDTLPPDTTPRSLQSTSRSSIYENPPVLSHEILQKLLAEAYCPISTKLTSVAEQEEYTNESDTEFEPISAEAWKIMAEEEIDEEDLKNLSYSQNGRLSETSFPDTKSINKYNQNIYSSSSDTHKVDYKDNNEKTTFLPEISKSPFLISQGLNNDSRLTRSGRASSSGDQNPIEIIRNSLKDSSIVLESFSDFGSEAGDSATPTPRPPSCDKRPSSHQSSRSVRTTTSNNS